MNRKSFVSAVIVAAGSATRMNTDKIILPLNGVPCICRTMLAFEEASTVGEIVVVTRSDLIPVMDEFAKEYGISKYKCSVVGGTCRQDSAAKGFYASSPAFDFIAVHDGARPLITPSEIDGVNKDAYDHGSAVCAVRVKDTIKVMNEDGFVKNTPDRSSLVAVSTPQSFSKKIYTQMVETFSGSFDKFTDDSGMAESIGHRVKLFFCSYSNIKITTPEDVPFAEELLKKQN